MNFTINFLLIIFSVVNGLNSIKAVVNFVPSEFINGTAKITPTRNGVSIQLKFQGLTPGSVHGWHIHEFGDISDGCKAAGGHYNPSNSSHGDPTHKNHHHVGDLGNFQADEEGLVFLEGYFEDINLEGENSILGRTIVVHANGDDLGKGGDAASLANGNSGARISCGVIGVAA